MTLTSEMGMGVYRTRLWDIRNEPYYIQLVHPRARNPDQQQVKVLRRSWF